MRFVIDTNILVSALRSRHGASYKLVRSLPLELFEPALSVPLYTEYQDVLTRSDLVPGFESDEIIRFLRYFCSICHLQEIFYLWRPFLKDPKDDMVLELAVASSSQVIVTHNEKDFTGSEAFKIEIMKPGDFLERIGGNQ